MLKDSIKLTGRLSIKKYDKEGKVNYEKEVPNLVVTSGKEFIAQRLCNNDFDFMSHMAVGDDASTAAVNQTALQNELARVAVSSAAPSGVSATFNATFGANVGTGALVEAGIFNAAASAVKTFDGDNDVDDASDVITINSHGFTTADKVTYTDGGNTAITGLSDGGTYYVIVVDSNEIKLAASESDANAGTQINITGTSGAGHKLTAGTMLCRTTFPVINKSSTETVAISWVITVG
jgi:hypothetical protein